MNMRSVQVVDRQREMVKAPERKKSVVQYKCGLVYFHVYVFILAIISNCYIYMYVYSRLIAMKCNPV